MDKKGFAMVYECHGTDTQEVVGFYERDFYVLSNFSSFTLRWKGLRFDTSEAVYHWEKFNLPADHDRSAQHRHDAQLVQNDIRTAISAHEAFQLAQRYKGLRRTDWDDVKVDIMLQILREKVKQHEYVRRKLLATGDRLLVEDSWRDDVWGTGPKGDGYNLLGKCWMQIREEVKEAAARPQ